MGSAEICLCCHRSRHLTISLLFLFVSSQAFVGFLAHGRAITNLLETAQVVGVVEEEKLVVVVRTQTIGSRPPRCDRRCSSCGHCEAVQVPVTTEAQRHSSHLSATISHAAYSRGDDVSNYKPMSWKCKCGNLILNP